jgi:hypothetical protein
MQLMFKYRWNMQTNNRNSVGTCKQTIVTMSAAVPHYFAFLLSSAFTSPAPTAAAAPPSPAPAPAPAPAAFAARASTALRSLSHQKGSAELSVLLAVLVVHVVPDGRYHEPSDPPWVPVGEWSKGSEGSGERKSEMELEEMCSECKVTSNPTHPRKLSAKGVKGVKGVEKGSLRWS